MLPQRFAVKIIFNFIQTLIYCVLRQVRQHGFRLGEAPSDSMFGLDQAPGAFGRHPKEARDPFLSRQVEAQREFLVRRGFSPTHPYISGEVPIHPELQGQLPFNVPSR